MTITVHFHRPSSQTKTANRCTAGGSCLLPYVAKAPSIRQIRLPGTLGRSEQQQAADSDAMLSTNVSHATPAQSLKDSVLDQLRGGRPVLGPCGPAVRAERQAKSQTARGIRSWCSKIRARNIPWMEPRDLTLDEARRRPHLARSAGRRPSSQRGFLLRVSRRPQRGLRGWERSLSCTTGCPATFGLRC